MTEDQDQTLEGGAGEGESLNLSPNAQDQQTTDQEHEGSGGDPLDDIKDEAARAEAKKFRAIARRHKDSDEAPAPTPAPKAPAPATSGEFLTKKDFYKSNEKKAIRIATAERGVIGPDGEVIATAEEVKAHWNEIVPGFTSRRGKELPEDILEDITDAVILWKGRQKKPKADNGARDLSTTAGGGTGGPGIKSKDAPAQTGIKSAVQPTEWFPKKS